ncbi:MULTISPECIES: hypothetical protein [unclassified Ensifer]|uniref:hypothetical protein n=1 Tax=unclassified Ensifer TaxID=2633371 RepID=UPI001374784C|nr:MULTISPECIES: hypothetical protein [unclassified Ensifer]
MSAISFGDRSPQSERRSPANRAPQKWNGPGASNGHGPYQSETVLDRDLFKKISGIR